MSLEIHREAERYMALADHAKLLGEDPSGYWRSAAFCEIHAFRYLPLDKPRTRGITAISAVVLYQRAGDYDVAARHIHNFVQDETLPEWARLDLQDLLEEPAKG